jgi:predicted dehydrogenase
MTKKQMTNRRDFLKLVCGAGAVAAFPAIVPAKALGLGKSTAPGNRIRLGVIGVGAGWPMFLREDVEYVAVCDVQQGRRDFAKFHIEEKQGTGTCTTYNDFRELLARKDVDAVYIATPDHWHSLITIAAAKAGKHVYCQKPLTRTVAEGQAVVDAVNRQGIVFQHGTQQRHDERMLFGMELVRNGYIGELKHVRLGSPAGSSCPPHPSQPVPAGLDWDMWLGPAPWAPFTPARIMAHPWYHISDYCMGYIAGWGIHHADSAMQGSGLDDYSGPIEVDARGLFPPDGLFDNPYRWQMHYRFSSGLTWHWTDCFGDGFGSRAGKDWPQNRMGITFEGTEGSVFIWRNEVDAEPKKLLKVRIGPGDKVRLRDNLPGDFIDCVRLGRKSCAPVDIAQRATNLCSIAAIGMQLGRKMTWDAARQEFLGDDQANRLRSRHMRGNWVV